MTASHRKLSLAAALALAFSIVVLPPASAAHVTCGTVITQNTTLDSNVGPCANNGIIVGADNITLDLNGFTVSGTSDTGDGIGIVVEGRTGVQVKGPGTVTAFDAGVGLIGGSGNKVFSLSAVDNVGSALGALAGDYGDGIAIENSHGNQILKNTVTGNGPFSGIAAFLGSDNNEINGNVVTDNAELNFGRIGGHHLLATMEDDGIRLEPGSVGNLVVNNVVKRNGLDGIAVFNGATDNVVKNNTVEANGFHEQSHRRGDGIRVFGTGHRTLVQDNSVFGNAANGIIIQSQNNQILTNKTGDNAQRPGAGSAYDLLDTNSDPPCDANVWSGNTYGTASPDCTKA